MPSGLQFGQGPLLRSSPRSVHFCPVPYHLPIDCTAQSTSSLLMVAELHRGHVKSFEHRSQMERIYMINARYGQTDEWQCPSHSPTSDGSTPLSDPTSSRPTSKTSSSQGSSSLRDLYLNTICKVSGEALKHLIFPLKWPMTSTMVAKLIRACPNLTQLSACIECEGVEIWKILMPFLKHLWAMRLHIISWDACDGGPASPYTIFEGSPQFTQVLTDLLSTGDYDSLRYIGIGSAIYEAVGWEDHIEQIPIEGPGQGDGAFREQILKKRKIVQVRREDVKDIAIWKYDTLDVI